MKATTRHHGAHLNKALHLCGCRWSEGGINCLLLSSLSLSLLSRGCSVCQYGFCSTTLSECFSTRRTRTASSSPEPSGVSAHRPVKCKPSSGWGAGVLPLSSVLSSDWWVVPAHRGCGEQDCFNRNNCKTTRCFPNSSSSLFWGFFHLLTS